MTLPETDARLDAVLFGEAQSRVVLSAAPEHADALGRLVAEHGARATRIGTVGGDALVVSVGRRTILGVAVSDLARPYHAALPDAMDALAVA